MDVFRNFDFDHIMLESGAAEFQAPNLCPGSFVSLVSMSEQVQTGGSRRGVKDLAMTPNSNSNSLEHVMCVFLIVLLSLKIIVLIDTRQQLFIFFFKNR